MTTPHRADADAEQVAGPLTISVRLEGDTAVVVLAGELDVATAPELRTAIDRLLLTGRNRIVLDLEAVTFLDAAAIDVMITATLAAAVSGGTLSVTPHAPLMQLLSFTCETHRVNVGTTVQSTGTPHPVPGVPLVRPRGTDATRAPSEVRADDHLTWLLEQAGDGDERAFLAVYDATAARAYGVALHLLGDRDEAAEVVEEAYLDLWVHPAAFRSCDVNATAWVLGAVHRCVVARVRSRRPDVTAWDAARPATPGPPGLEAVLSPGQRDAVELAYFGGHLHTEVERLRGLPVGTARSRIRDGLLKLRDASGSGSTG